MVDATDRLRVGECKTELRELLLEEVSPLSTKEDWAEMLFAEAVRSKLTGIPKQNRCAGLHE